MSSGFDNGKRKRTQKLFIQSQNYKKKILNFVLLFSFGKKILSKNQK